MISCTSVTVFVITEFAVASSSTVTVIKFANASTSAATVVFNPLKYLSVILKYTVTLLVS